MQIMQRVHLNVYARINKMSNILPIKVERDRSEVK